MARILQVCNSDFYLSFFLIPLVKGLVEAGHEVDCACEGTDIAGLLPKGVGLYSVPMPRSPSPRAFWQSIQSVRSVIRGKNYDCVDSHNRNGSIVGRVAGWLERVPVNLYTAHGFYFHDGQNPVAFGSTVAIEALLARITDHTLSQSTDDVSFMTSRRLIARSRIEVIGNGIDTRRFSPRRPEERRDIEASLGLRSGRFRIAATGRLVRGKGFMDLLLAFAELHGRHPDTELLMIGGTVRVDIEPFVKEFQAKTRELGLVDAVTVTGIVKDVERYLAASDIFVLPSYREGVPRALLEAMSMGLPALATNIRGCKEVIRPGLDGWLFEPHDIPELERLLDLAYREPTERTAMAARGRSRILAEYDERDYVARQVAAIGRLTGEPELKPRSASNVHSSENSQANA